MKNIVLLTALLSTLSNPLSTAIAATTIDSANKFAYGANIGWMDWTGDTANGAVIGEYVCSGYIYSANVGWISLSSGLPANGIYYQNNSATDFGVTNDGLGNLRGYAWGANIGWIKFENTGTPKVDLFTGHLSGYIWSANCGWISLSNAVAYVQTDTISPGLLDTNGLPVAWELTFFGHMGIDPNADPDGDGQSNLQEYLAGTNPTDGTDYLHITAESFAPGGASATLTWSSVPTRFYYIQKTPALNPLPTWFDSGLSLISPSAGSTTTRSFADINAPMRFYRVEAVKPLSP